MSPTMESSEFTIRRKDFPALPGNVSSSDTSSESSWSEESSDVTTTGQSDTPRDHDTSASRDINISADGRVSNIPHGMINDQFGMIGLLTFIRAVEEKPSLKSLTFGEDLTSLGLNLQSSDNLYPHFEGPWEGVTDYKVSYVPYKLTSGVRQRLANVYISKYEDDLLFYLFYTSARDVLQLVAAAELYRRGWRYHTTLRLWMCSLPNGLKVEDATKSCLSSYYVFDVASWRKVIKECYLDCGKIEGRPVVSDLFRLL